jgi:hypothetical protein
LSLWRKALHQPAYLVGFLAAQPDALPEPRRARADAPRLQAALAPLAAQGNAAAGLLLKLVAAAGQTYLQTLARFLDSPPNPELLTRMLDLLRAYLAPIHPGGDPDLPLAELLAEAEAFAEGTGAPAVAACLAAAPEQGPSWAALRLLSGLGYGVLRPLLRDSNATGSLMRRKLAPVLEPVTAAIAVLLDESGTAAPTRPARRGRRA